MTERIRIRIAGWKLPAVALCLAALMPQAPAATFGSAAPIAGPTSDMALDEARGVLSVANFGAARVEVVSLAKPTAAASIHMAPYPGSMALSPGGRFLVTAPFGDFQPPNSAANALTAGWLHALVPMAGTTVVF